MNMRVLYQCFNKNIPISYRLAINILTKIVISQTPHLGNRRGKHSMGKGSGLPCQPGGNASPGGGPPHRAAPQARGGCRSTTTYRVGQGGPSRGRPGRNPTRPWRWIASSGFLSFNRTPSSPTPVSQWRGTVVVLSLCEAAKREFGGFVQRVFRGFTSTIKLGVFEHPTPVTTLITVTESLS